MMPEERRAQQWKAALAATAECLSIDELSRLAEGSPDGEAESRTSSHLSNCSRCQTELAMLQEFEHATPRPEEAAEVAFVTGELKRRFRSSRPVAEESGLTRPAPRRTGRLVARKSFAIRSISTAAMSLAAMLLLIAGALYLRSGKEPLLVSDGSSGQTVLRSQAITLLEPKGDLEQTPAELRWQPVSGAARYSLKLMEVDRTVLWESSSEQSRLMLPQPVREKIVPGKTLLWEVTAIEAGGEPVATSPVERFRVAIRPRR